MTINNQNVLDNLTIDNFITNEQFTKYFYHNGKFMHDFFEKFMTEFFEQYNLN